MRVLWLFSWPHSHNSLYILQLLYSSYQVYTTCVVAISLAYEQDVLRTEIEINLGLICRYPYHFSKQQQPISVKWEETSYVYISQYHIYMYIYKTSNDTCRGTNVWLLIGSKFDKNSWKLDKVDKARCTWPFQAKHRCHIRCETVQSQGYWRVICTWFQNVPFFSPKWTGIHFFLAKYAFLNDIKIGLVDWNTMSLSSG